MNSLYSLLYSQEHPGGYSGYTVYTARAQGTTHKPPCPETKFSNQFWGSWVGVGGCLKNHFLQFAWENAICAFFKFLFSRF